MSENCYQECPNVKRHTRCPSAYLEWHEWAERKAKTHRQVKCPGCGLYAIWRQGTGEAAVELGDVQ